MRNGANHSKHHGCNVTCANLSHAYMRDQKCSGVRVLDTTRLRKMCVRRGVLSSLPLRARHVPMFVRETI